MIIKIILIFIRRIIATLLHFLFLMNINFSLIINTYKKVVATAISIR